MTQGRTDKTGQTRQDRQDRTDKTGQTEQDRQNRTDETDERQTRYGRHLDTTMQSQILCVVTMSYMNLEDVFSKGV